jgi:sugar transferase EpsL
VKPIFDIVAALLGLILLSPVMIVVAMLVRIKIGSPVLFTQLRPGLHGRPIKVYKFRTMSDLRNSEGQLYPDEERLTAFGKRLRRMSLDELPQLFNVIKGELSLVGPRPLLMQYLERYTPEQARRHEVKPGITGWAQVNGRNAIGWDEKFSMDVWYVDNRSFGLDLKILWMTFIKVFKREGISQAGRVTVEEFMGDDHNGKE